MSESRAVALVGAVVLVGLVVTGVVRGLAGGHEPEQPPIRDAPAANHADAEQPRSWSTATTGASVQVGSTTIASAASPSRPAGPALAGPAAEEAVAMAERVLRADLVGEGREQFAHYWGEGLYRPCCTEVVVHSGVARPSGRGETVVVSLVFSARRLDAGVPLEQAGSDVYLVRRDGGWLPVHPSEGGA